MGSKPNNFFIATLLTYPIIFKEISGKQKKLHPCEWFAKTLSGSANALETIYNYE